MISRRAEMNQKSSKVKILSAFYGQKAAIKHMLDTKIHCHDPLSTDKVEQLQSQYIFETTPRYTIDVTISVQFHLTKEGLNLSEGSKESLVGFFRPMPDSMSEDSYLCVVY